MDQLTKTLALVGGTIHKDFGRDNGSEGQECLYEFCIPKLLRQVIDEEVTAFGACRNRSRLVQGKDPEGHPHRQRPLLSSPQALTFSLLLRQS